VVALLADCDDDTVLVKARRLGDGNVCHTGARSCFNTSIEFSVPRGAEGPVTRG
jgi:phosphoribosyl-AMP cyclohydrolase